MVFSVVTIEKSDNFYDKLTVIVPSNYVSQDGLSVYYSDFPANLDDCDFIKSFVVNLAPVPPSFSLHKCRFEFEAAAYRDAVVIVQVLDKKRNKSKKIIHHSILTCESEFAAEDSSLKNGIKSDRNLSDNHTVSSLLNSIVPLIPLDKNLKIVMSDDSSIESSATTSTFLIDPKINNLLPDSNKVPVSADTSIVPINKDVQIINDDSGTKSSSTTTKLLIDPKTIDVLPNSYEKVL